MLDFAFSVSYTNMGFFGALNFFLAEIPQSLVISKILFPTSRLCVHPLVSACVRRLAPIPAGESQDVTNKSCSICLRGDKNTLRVTP